MQQPELRVRPLTQDDFNDVVRIDRIHFGAERADYYARRFAKALDSSDQVMISLVAEVAGQVTGFIMGSLHLGEYGIPGNTASVDSIGVDPQLEHRGVGRALMDAFLRSARIAGVDKVYTRVMWNDLPLVRFFDSVGFVPAQMTNLELTMPNQR